MPSLSDAVSSVREAGVPPLALLIVPFLAWYVWSTLKAKRAREDASLRLALEKGCLPAPLWNAKWPLALDMLIDVFRYSRRSQILKYMIGVTEANAITFTQMLLGVRGIGTIDPANVEAILSTNFDDFGLGLRSPTFHPLLGSGIFTQDGDAWKQSRRLLRDPLSTGRSKNFDQIKLCVENLVSSILLSNAKAPDPNRSGKPVDLQPLFFGLTFETTLFLLFGEAVSSSMGMDWAGEQVAAATGKPASRESVFAKAFNVGQEYLAHRGRLGPYYWLYSSKEFRDACRTCHAFVESAIAKSLGPSFGKDAAALKKTAQATADDADHDVFIKTLARLTQDRTVLRDQALNVLLAGRDTTGCCLGWTFRLLARHQHVLGRLRKEAESICGIGAAAEPPTKAQLKKMHYLHCVIKEVLRLYPSVPVNSREAVRDTVLPVGGGPDGTSPVLVHKGEGVGYCVYAMHRRKDLYGEDAGVFRPERWEGDELKDIGWGYLPFNRGPRVCLGQEFAQLEINYTVSRLIQVFPSITVPEDEPDVPIGDERQNLTLVVCATDGCRLILN